MFMIWVESLEKLASIARNPLRVWEVVQIPGRRDALNIDQV